MNVYLSTFQGKPFIAKGINVASADWDATYKPGDVMKAVAATGANAVRLLWLPDDKIGSKGLSDANLIEAIQKAIDYRLVPMVHLWYDSGSIGEAKWDSVNYLWDAGKFWAKKIGILKKFERHLLINVVNEWVCF